MTTATLRPPPTWQLAVASLAPRRYRERAEWLAGVVPLGAILAVQFALSLRLDNTPHSDEALYLFTGHWIRSGEEVYSGPETFFSGSPSLYPVFGSYVDSVGGMELARIVSGLCMLSATVAVYWTTTVLFEHRGYGRRAALFAALVFGTSAPVIFLGHFATFDAPSFSVLAWATAVAIWSSKRNTSPWWSLAIGGLCALAVALKYSSAIDVPFVLLLTLVGWPLRNARMRTLVRAMSSGLVTIILLAASALTWARNDLSGLLQTTLMREVGSVASPAKLSADVLAWTGVALVLMTLGGLNLLRRQPILAAVLLSGTAAAMGYQIHMGEGTSLHKHVVLGLIFGAPLAGLFLAELCTRIRSWGVGITAVTLWGALLVGLSQSAALFNGWPDRSALSSTLGYSIDNMPYIRVLGDAPEAQVYDFWEETEPWQWVGTWEDSFFYKGTSNLPAYQRALRDNYFQLVFLETDDTGRSVVGCGARCESMSAQLLADLPSSGFTLTSTVTASNSSTQWQVWQRFDRIPRGAEDSAPRPEPVDVTWIRFALTASLLSYGFVLVVWALSAARFRNRRR